MLVCEFIQLPHQHSTQQVIVQVQSGDIMGMQSGDTASIPGTASMMFNPGLGLALAVTVQS